MLRKEEPAMALVSLEAALAPAAIDAALEAGCHVMTEKPACVRAADFRPLARKAEQRHRHLMLTLANRTMPPVREARRLIAGGKLGKLYGAEVHIIADQTRLTREAYRKAWYSVKARAGGGHLIWLGIHWLDLALFITGLKVREVAGFAGVVGGQPIDVEDSAAVALRFDNGCFGTMTSGYFLDRGYQSHIQVWGEHGWLRLAAAEEEPLEWYSTRDTKDPKVQKFDYPKGERGYTPFVRAGVRAGAGLEPAPIAPGECLHVLEAIFAFYEAVKTGKAQDV
jgi:predicted dehydrogenase